MIDSFLMLGLIVLLPVLLFPMFVGCGVSTLQATSAVNVMPLTIRAFVQGSVSLRDSLDFYASSSQVSEEELIFIQALREELDLGIVDPGRDPVSIPVRYTLDVRSSNQSLVSTFRDSTTQLELIPVYEDQSPVIQDWVSNTLVAFPVVPLPLLAGQLEEQSTVLSLTLRGVFTNRSGNSQIPFLAGSADFSVTYMNDLDLAADFVLLNPQLWFAGRNILATRNELRIINT